MARRLLSSSGSSGGGGGGSSSSTGAIKPTTLYDEDEIGTWDQNNPLAWDEHTTYARVHQYSPRGQFAIHSHTFSSGARGGANFQTNRLRIAPFLVDQSTGQMTFGSQSSAFENTSGYVHSTMSYGFGGTYGMNWGHSAWGSGNTHYNGGCVWRIVNNAVTGGESSGNSSYASENTSNGNLPIYEDNGTAYYNIPNGNYTSLGSINTAGNNADWATSQEHNWSGSTTYIYRCIGKDVGVSHAGVGVNQNYIQAMNAEGSQGGTGQTWSAGGNQAQNGGIGFELESGKQVFFTCKGTYIRSSRTGGLQYKATVTLTGNASSIPNIGGSGSDLALIGVGDHNYTYHTGGYPAKEDDTFYYYSGTDNDELIKFKITNPSSSTIQLQRIGAVDLSEIGGAVNLNTYKGLVDVTGNDDQFIVCSYRPESYGPSHTIVVDNPIKDLTA